MSLPEPLPDRPSTKGKTVMYLMIIAALGIVVFLNYYIKTRNELKAGRLPKMARVETDLDSWVDQDGKPRQLAELKGKITVVSYVYTTCPQGCAGIADEMAKLQKEFGNDPRFQLLSISLYPEHDRPEVLKAWRDAKGFTGENWWFLTSKDGQGDDIRKFVAKNFGIAARRKSPEELAKNPTDLWEHQLVMVLMDDKGRIRTPTDKDYAYWPFHEAFDYGWYPRPIREDVAKLLDEAKNRKE